MEENANEEMRLNKFIAHCGITNRRAANELIKQGLVKVNNEVVKNPATKVALSDIVMFRDAVVKPLEPLHYVLMNKPKNVAVNDEEESRKTVLDIVQPKYKETIFITDKLAKMDTGLLLLSNDQELIDSLNRSSQKVNSVYHLELATEANHEQLFELRKGLQAKGKSILPEKVEFIEGREYTNVGVEMSAGNADDIRSLFTSVGLTIEKLDRVNFAGLTKKDLPRGWFRNLKKKEIVMLKHFG